MTSRHRVYPSQPRGKYFIEDRGFRTPCWIWQGSINRKGYGPHRRYWERATGKKVPDGLEIDHLCRVRACVNPNHLEPVTHVENLTRGNVQEITRARHAKVTRCPKGHEYIPENTIYKKHKIKSGKAYFVRKCRICLNAASRRIYRQKVSGGWRRKAG
jgi:Pyruvate/2-oxoacid:ferredoxin oxidoreductase delta subunit